MLQTSHGFNQSIGFTPKVTGPFEHKQDHSANSFKYGKQSISDQTNSMLINMDSKRAD